MYTFLPFKWFCVLYSTGSALGQSSSSRYPPLVSNHQETDSSSVVDHTNSKNDANKYFWVSPSSDSETPEMKIITGTPTGRMREITNLTDKVAEASLTAASSRADHGRSMGDGLTHLLSRFSKVLDLGKVVKEIETSVMTSVSCTACKAGLFFYFYLSLFDILYSLKL